MRSSATQCAKPTSRQLALHLASPPLWEHWNGLRFQPVQACVPTKPTAAAGARPTSAAGTSACFAVPRHRAREAAGVHLPTCRAVGLPGMAQVWAPPLGAAAPWGFCAHRALSSGAQLPGCGHHPPLPTPWHWGSEGRPGLCPALTPRWGPGHTPGSFQGAVSSQASSILSLVCPLQPEFQHPASALTSGHASWLGRAARMQGLSLLVCLYPAHCKPTAPCLSGSQKLLTCPRRPPSLWRRLWGWGTLSSFIVPSLGWRSLPHSGYILSSYLVPQQFSCSFGCTRSSASTW